MKAVRPIKLSLGCAVLGLCMTACTPPAIQNPQVLNGLVGTPALNVLRDFGTPTGHYEMAGHLFLSYTETQTQYSPGTMDWGWGWGDGWGYGGYGYGYGGWGGDWGPEIPPTYYTSSCSTTFEIVNDLVKDWKLRGSGC